MGRPAFSADSADYVSPADYLRLEQAAAFKHEYFEGEIRAMAGASFAHNRICANLTIALGIQLRGSSCTPVGSNQRLQILSGSAYVSPDLTVVCGPPVFNEDKKPDTLLNPTLLVEVLSPSTANNDRGEKFMYYRQIPTLRQYLLLDSEKVHAELYTLDELGRWVLTETRDPAAVLALGPIGCQLALADAYAGVPLAAAGPGPGPAANPS